ncbi:polyprenyl synthetase family protein [Kocuria sp. M1R5S2]|uniref:polyprenyl synthetase family protein n=1 Tax=Kocuria rhizosphaerae TaxID=3376285 RepID=UPI003789DC33
MTETSSPSAGGPATGPGTDQVKLPAGFDLIASDDRLGPVVLQALARIEERLDEAVRSADQLADVTSRHLLQAGGKRVRPLLTVLAGEIGGGVNDAVLEAAAVVELTHLATLYHDDVMDSAPLRRGVATAQTVWGNSVAILTGDLIFARASSMVSDLGQRALKIQADTFERLVLGQLHETVGPADGEDHLEHYLGVLAGKTGSLIAACGHFGTVLAGAGQEVVDVMVDYGEKVGIAFQLADDVIDVTGEDDVSGKSPGTDLREGVPTLPVLLLRRMAQDGDADARRAVELLDADLASDEALARAVAAVSGHPATQEAWRMARHWADQAVASLEPLPDSVAKRALTAFAHAVVHREA